METIARNLLNQVAAEKRRNYNAVPPPDCLRTTRLPTRANPSPTTSVRSPARGPRTRSPRRSRWVWLYMAFYEYSM